MGIKINFEFCNAKVYKGISESNYVNKLESLDASRGDSVRDFSWDLLKN